MDEHEQLKRLVKALEPVMDTLMVSGRLPAEGPGKLWNHTEAMLEALHPSMRKRVARQLKAAWQEYEKARQAVADG